MSPSAMFATEREDRTCELLDALEARRRAALAERQAARLLHLLTTAHHPVSRNQEERAAMKSLYKVLGLGPQATPAELRSAHRKLARQYHTDSAGGDRARFQEVQEAYETLSDPARRREYDAQRAAWLAEQGAVDCPGCGTATRLKSRGLASRCPLCKTALTEETAEGRLKRKALRTLQGATELAEHLVEAAVAEGVQAAQDAVRAKFQGLRTRLDPGKRS